MAIRSADQISIVDITDAYSVILTNDSYTFPGSTNAAKAGSCTTQVIAMRGAEQIPATVDLADVTKPAGITVTKDTDATAPTLTITASTSFTTAGVVKIPVVVDGDITITKDFSVAIAFTGAKGDTGAHSNIWTATANATTPNYTFNIANLTGPTGTTPQVGDIVLWAAYRYTISAVGETTVLTGDRTSIQGSTGAGGIWYTGTGITGTSTTATIFSGSGVSSAKVGDMYLNTDTYNTYRCTTAGAPAAAKWVYVSNIKGAKGDTGDAAITMSVTSSNGTIFKNSTVETVLTAHVYQGGVEVTETALTALGTIKWYKDGGTTAVATGQTLTISAGDVTSKATYIAQLEG